jgi:hypothetical protein
MDAEELETFGEDREEWRKEREEDNEGVGREPSVAGSPFVGTDTRGERVGGGVCFHGLSVYCNGALW